MTENIVSGYDLSGGANSWSSTLLTGYSFFYLDFVYSNIAGTSELIIRETDAGTGIDSLYSEIQKVLVVKPADAVPPMVGSTTYESVNNINVTKKYLNVQYLGGVTQGKLSVILRAERNKLQTHNVNDDSHEPLKRYTLLLS